jgi:hypothetical protein
VRGGLPPLLKPEITTLSRWWRVSEVCSGGAGKGEDITSPLPLRKKTSHFSFCPYCRKWKMFSIQELGTGRIGSTNCANTCVCNDTCSHYRGGRYKCSSPLSLFLFPSLSLPSTSSYSALLYFTSRHLTSLYFTLLYFTLFHFSLLYFNLKFHTLSVRELSKGAFLTSCLQWLYIPHSFQTISLPLPTRNLKTSQLSLR